MIRKWIAGLLAGVVCLMAAACSTQPEEVTGGDTLNLEKAEKEIASLTFTPEGESGSEALFPSLSHPDEQTLKELYGIDVALLDEYVIGISDASTEAGLYLILKPASGKEDDVKNMVGKSIGNYGQQFSLYSPEAAKLVDEHLETLRGDYLVYAISRDNNAVMDAIDGAME